MCLLGISSFCHPHSHFFLGVDERSTEVTQGCSEKFPKITRKTEAATRGVL